tara:strand:+ start:59 stop:751 length:693 start_codon:yes stop_codon:yes gene_type:complete
MLKKLSSNNLLSYLITISFFILSCETNDLVSYGCTDPSANNYDPLVSQDDGSCDFSTASQLEIIGIIDFSLGNISGKAIHLKAKANIADLSIYSLGVANNGGGTDGIEITFNSISVSAGDDILIARDEFLIGEYFSTCFTSFEYIFQDDAVNQNGDDAVELFYNDEVVETFGDINVNGTGTAWEYTDSWAYKDVSGSVTFGSGNWIFGAINCTDGTATIFESSCLYPLCQ